MSDELPTPNLTISLPLDAHAPRAARYHVAQVDRPSPDLRDAVVLLTSELVTRAVERCPSAPSQAVELRVWMPQDVVRVEVRAPQGPDDGAMPAEAPDYHGLLFGQVADRWSVANAEGALSCLWFEIDRHRPAVPSTV